VGARLTKELKTKTLFTKKKDLSTKDLFFGLQIWGIEKDNFEKWRARESVGAGAQLV